jgi:hypothetical protein
VVFQFRWLTRVALAVGLVGALVAAPSLGGSHLLTNAEAMSTQSVSGTWGSAVTVLNPSTSPGNADVTVDFYNSAGTLVSAATQTATVAPGTTAFWYVPNIVGLPAGQTYSAVVSASQQVYATVNLGTMAATTPIMGETYNGADQLGVATSASVPSVLRNYFGFTSNVVIQNAGSAATNVQLSITGNNGITNFLTPSVNVAANASTIVDLATLTNLGDGFIGAATAIGGANNIAVISNNYTPSELVPSAQPDFLFSSVNAIPPFASGTTAFIPGLYRDYYGFFSALLVQNVDTTNADILVTYENGVTESAIGVVPGASHNFFTPNTLGLPTGIHSAVVTAGGKKILAQVNVQGKPGTVSGVGLASYSGSTGGTLNVFAPGLLKNYFTFNSALTIQNVDTVSAPAGSITVSYSNGATHTNPTALAPGQSYLMYTPNEPGLPASFNGGATIVSTTAKIVGLINISGTNTADQLFSTNAFGS